MSNNEPQSREVRCDNCGVTMSECYIRPLEITPHLNERLDPGSEVPAGECQCCGALCYLVKPRSTGLPTIEEICEILDWTEADGTSLLDTIRALDWHAKVSDRSLAFTPANLIQVAIRVCDIIESTYRHDDEGNRVDGDSPVSGADVVDMLLALEDDLHFALSCVSEHHDSTEALEAAALAKEISDHAEELKSCANAIESLALYIQALTAPENSRIIVNVMAGSVQNVQFPAQLRGAFSVEVHDYDTEGSDQIDTLDRDEEGKPYFCRLHE